MATLVTGAGQIGCQVARILVDQGQEPVVYDVRLRPEFVETVVPIGRLKIRQGDIRDLSSLTEVIREHAVDRIIHTAAILPPLTEEDPQLTTEINVRGTANVLEAARLAGVRRVVFCSTIGVYDMRGIHGERVREDDPVGPDLVYSASKIYCEQMGQNYAHRKGVEFVALRFAHIYGPGPLPPRPGLGALVGEIASAAMRGGRSSIRPRTLAAREYLYVVDAARAAVLAANSSEVKDCVFNIGTGRLHDPGEMARIACEMAPGAEIDLEEVKPTGAGQSVETPGRPFDLTRARAQLGYAPAYDLAAGMRAFMEYVNAQS